MMGIFPAIDGEICGNGVAVIGSGSTATCNNSQDGQHRAGTTATSANDGAFEPRRRVTGRAGRRVRQRRRRHRLRQHRHVRQHARRPAPAGTAEHERSNGSLVDVSPAAQADACGNGVAVIGSGSTAKCDNAQSLIMEGPEH